MEREKKIQDEYVDYRFGFPVILQHVEMIKIRDYWFPNINQNTLRELVLLSLIVKGGPLTGNQVHFIRRWLKETMDVFGRRFGITHAAVKKWEDKGDAPTGTKPPVDFYIRLIVIEKMLEKNPLVLRKTIEDLSQISSLQKIPEIFVVDETNEADSFHLSPHLKATIDERISSVPTSPESTSFDFGSFSTHDHKAWLFAS